MEKVSKTVRMVVSVSEARRQAKKDGTNILGCSCREASDATCTKTLHGRLSPQPFYKDRRNRSRNVAQKGNFLKKLPQATTATCNLAGAFWRSVP
jgi:hypothetical protein